MSQERRIRWAFLMAVACAPAALGQAVPELFREAPAGVGAAAPARAPEPGGVPAPGIEVRRARPVEVDAGLLRGAAPKVRMTLFPGTAFEVARTRGETSADGKTLLWFGRIEGMHRGQAVFSLTGGVVSGSVVTDAGQTFQVRTLADGLQTVEEVEARRGYKVNDVVRVPDAERTPARRAPVVSAGTTIIDVMVVYTRAARNAAGGAVQIENRIEQAAAETNQAYLNSGASQQIRVVYKGEVSYTESGSIGTDLSRLRGTSDGFMDNVHTLRNTHGADMVCLWIHRFGAGGGTVGLAYMWDGPGDDFSPWAFSVVEQYWAPAPGYTFAHELGHNQGCDHDRQNVEPPLPYYSYAYGYQQPSPPFPVQPFSTIMAYDCEFVNCPTIPHFSNPTVLWQGQVTGQPENTPFAAFNAKVLNNTKDIAAGWRQASQQCEVTLAPSSIDATPAPGAGSFTVTAPAGCTWQASSGAAWITVAAGGSGSGNGTVSYTYGANAGAARGGTIAVGGKTFTINQSGSSGTACLPLFNGSTNVLDALSSSYLVNVAASPGCAWSMAAMSGWLTLHGAASGSGDGSVIFSALMNAGLSPRTASLKMGSAVFPLVQKTTAATQIFSDVPLTHPFYDYTALLRQNGVTTGCTATAFCPDGATTRGQMAVFLMRSMLGGDVFLFPQTPYFTDVPATHPYFKYIQKMRELGVTSGCTATTYCPDAPVTRGEMSVFLMRAKLGVTGPSFPYPAQALFADVPSSHPYFAYIQKMRELGVTTGCSAAQYCDGAATTRGQMAVFLIRTFYTP